MIINLDIGHCKHDNCNWNKKYKTALIRYIVKVCKCNCEF